MEKILNKYEDFLKKSSKYFYGEVVYFGAEFMLVDVDLHDNCVRGRLKYTDSQFESYIQIGNNYEVHTDCSCGHKQPCAHSVALFLYSRKNKCFDRLFDASLLEDPVQHFKVDENEKIIDIKAGEVELDRVKRLIKPKSLINDLIAKNSVKKKKWRPCFIISPKPINFTGEGAQVKLGMIYKKKDGSFGRVNKLNRNCVNIGLSNNKEESLANMLLQSDKGYLSLFSIIDRIFDLYNSIDKPYIYYKGHFYNQLNAYMEMKFLEIMHIDIVCVPVEMDFDKNQVEFRLDLRIIGVDGEEKFIAINEDSAHSLQQYLVFFSHDGIAYWCENRDNLKQFLNPVIKCEKLYKSEIEYLTEYARKEYNDFVRVVNNFEQVRIIEKKFVPVIEIDDSEREYDEINMNVAYKYGDNIVNSYEKDEYIFVNDFENGNVFLYKRLFAQEEKVSQYVYNLLEKAFGEYDIGHGKRVWNPDYVFEYVIYKPLQELYEEFLIPVLREGYELKYYADKNTIKVRHGNLSVKVESSGINWFDIDADFVDQDGEKIDIGYKSVFSNDFIINKNEIIFVSKDNISKLESLIYNGMDENGKLKISNMNYDLINQLYHIVESSEMQEDFKKSFNISQKIKNFDKIEQISIADGFKGKLREYQVAGYHWLHFLHQYGLNGILADDMGLGKTVQTLAYLQYLKENNNLNTSILVVPVTTISNWISEIKKFTTGLTFVEYHGSNRIKNLTRLLDYDIIITSYATLRNDVEIFVKHEFDYIILDEAQIMKNYKSQIFKALKILKSKHKLSLSGTPIENSLIELWSHSNFLNPGLFGSLSLFKKKYFYRNMEAEIEHELSIRETLSENTQKRYDANKKKKENLKKIIYPFILRRKKEDVAKELPEKEEIIYKCNMNEGQIDFYEQLRMYYLEKINQIVKKEGISKASIYIIEGMLRLRQCAIMPSMVVDSFNKMKKQDKLHGNFDISKLGNIHGAKIDLVKDLIGDVVYENHKVLVFSQFIEPLKKIKQFAKNQDFKYSYLDGTTKNRNEEIQRFQEDENTKLFLISLKAGGVGINLTAADYVIILDPWWNPAVERQAIDRTHRIGQDKKVIVYKFISKNSIEEKILKLQEMKKNVSDDVVNVDDEFFKSLSKDEMLSVFQF